MNPEVGHWYLPVLGLAVGGVFVRRELRIRQPFIDLRVLGGNIPLLATFTRQCLAYITSYAFFYGYSQWLQEGRGLGAPQAGRLCCRCRRRLSVSPRSRDAAAGCGANSS
jgi:hypothetical protein